MTMKRLTYLIILLSQFSLAAWAQSFVIRNIDFDGLQRISPATAETYLPVKRGQTMQPAKASAILRALYKTGFFDNITVSQRDNTLVIHVVERPTIGQLKITGNSIVPTDKLTSVMKSMDIAEGRVYNPAIIEKIKQSLLNQYYQVGRYNARVTVTTTPMSRNRVIVQIKISEGLIAKVRRISIIGNNAFDEATLIKQIDLTTSGLTTFITQADRYSEEKLEASLDKLRNYYMDHGYIRFQIKSAQAQVTPDRKSVYVTIVVQENAQYTVKDYQITGNYIVSRDEIEKRIIVKRGAVFSRQQVMDSEKAITKLLGEQGYMFAAVELHPQLNDKDHTLVLVFDIRAGKRTYIRHITFSDNNRTNDEVLRREIEQMEAAPASTTKLDQSKQRLQLLPYIKEVDMSVNPVQEADDQVDVNYKVKEDNSAQATFKLGYSPQQGPFLGAGVNQKNFFGTGNTLGLNLTRSKIEQYYGLDYSNPYYTDDGVSRSINLAVSKVNPGNTPNVDNAYTNNEYDLGVLYGIPVGQEQSVFNRVHAGATYQNTVVHIVPSSLSNQVNTFVSRHGTHFQELDLKLGYTRDSRDKAIFATNGGLHTLFLDMYAPLTSQSLSYYTVNYHGKYYQPLSEQFIMLTRGDLGYGNGFHGVTDFPFFRNYYAGGIDSVRGFQSYTLGPRDSNYRSFGGNFLVDGSVALIFPNHLTDSLRTSIFFDLGNVYSSMNNRLYGGQSTNSGPLRYATGLEADWLTPFGPIELSVAQPINRRSHDERETLQFALGANF